MHNYHEIESLNGSHFFLKSTSDCIYIFKINKTEDEYIEEFLDSNIYDTTLKNFTNIKPGFNECCSLFENLRKIIIEFAEKKDSIVKIELENTKSRKDLITKFFLEMPNQIRGLTHVVNGNKVYYFFDSNRIDSTMLISSLVKEFSDENNK